MSASRAKLTPVSFWVESGGTTFHLKLLAGNLQQLRLAALLALITLAFVSAGAADTEAARKDQAAIQGKWILTAGSRDGTVFTPEFMVNSTRVAKGDQVTVIIRGQLMMKAKFTLDPTQKPKTIDYEVSGGPYTGATQLGIYEIDGDKVKFCFSTPGSKRPKAFVTKANDGLTLSCWTREAAPAK